MFLHHCFERWRAAVTNQSLGARRRHIFHQHFLSDEAHAHLPVLALVRLLVNRQKQLELALMVFRIAEELLFQKDVISRPVTEDERHSRRVVVVEDGLDDLVARCDASAAGNQTDLSLSLELILTEREVSLAIVLKAPFRTVHRQKVANIHGLHVLRHRSAVWEPRVHILAVDLDQEVDIASLRDRRDGRVLTLHGVLLCLARLHHRYAEDDMFADGQTKHIVFFREAEPENVSVISDLDLVG